MNMIERVARAICVAQGEDPDKPICRGTGWKGRKVVTYWEYHEGDARAAIEATHAPEMLTMPQRILDADFGWGGAVGENEVHQLIKKVKGE